MIKNRKLNIKIIGVIFLALLCILMFLSRTIYTFNLPTVTAAMPASGELNQYESTSGITAWADVLEIYSQYGARIEKVHIKEGDKVEKGQKLFELEFDEEEINEKLKELEINKKKIELEIENLERKRSNKGKEVDKLEQSSTQKERTAYELEKLEIQIKKLEDQIEAAKNDYENSKLLYEAGAISKSELDNVKKALDNLQYDLNNLKNDYENQEEVLQQKLENYKEELKSMDQDLKGKNLDLVNLSNQEESYQKTLSDYNENTVITAPEDGTITEISIKEGQFINANQLMIGLGTGNQFELACDIILDNNFVMVGDTCDLTNSSHDLEGVVTNIVSEEQKKKVIVSLESEEVTSGETFDVEFSKASTTTYTLIPNGAINQDSDGYFIYQIKKRTGVLGDEFYVKKVSVYLGDSDNENTVIVKGMDFFEPIVILSDKSFGDEDIVKVENAGDFFEE